MYAKIIDSVDCLINGFIAKRYIILGVAGPLWDEEERCHFVSIIMEKKSRLVTRVKTKVKKIFRKN